MAKVVSLDNNPLVRLPSERAADVQKVLEEVAQQNAREEVRSIVVMTVDYHNQTWCSSVRDLTDDAAFLGQLEITKSDIIRRVQERRVVIEERPV